MAGFVCRPPLRAVMPQHAEAEAWLRKMAHRKVLDATKTPWRRLRLLVERLRGLGYRVNANTRAEDDDPPSAEEA